MKIIERLKRNQGTTVAVIITVICIVLFIKNFKKVGFFFLISIFANRKVRKDGRLRYEYL